MLFTVFISLQKNKRKINTMILCTYVTVLYICELYYIACNVSLHVKYTYIIRIPFTHITFIYVLFARGCVCVNTYVYTSKDIN